MSERNRYNKMENVLQRINGKFVSLSEADVNTVNPVLQKVIDTIVSKMQQTNVLFKSIYENNFYGGSYYDGLKVTKPEEFDVDLCLRLPKNLKVTVTISNEPGFVNLQVPGWPEYEKKPEAVKVKDLKKFIENGYIEYPRILKWMESVLIIALNELPRQGKYYIIQYVGGVIRLSTSKAGPAFTVHVEYNNLYFDVDLVPVFRMNSTHWPPSPFEMNRTDKPDYLLVPKPPKTTVGKSERLWRLSFQEQERYMMKNSAQNFKPALRLLKKFRDTAGHSQISSYYLKTIFLLEIDKQRNDPTFWRSPLSFVFMHMLKEYKNRLSEKKIPYYWNKRNNLLKNIRPETLENFKNYVARVIETIDRKMDTEPEIVETFLSTAAERQKINTLEITSNSSNNISTLSIAPQNVNDFDNKASANTCTDTEFVKKLYRSSDLFNQNLLKVSADINLLMNKASDVEEVFEGARNSPEQNDLIKLDIEDNILSNKVRQEDIIPLLTKLRMESQETKSTVAASTQHSEKKIDRLDQLDYIHKRMKELKKIADEAMAEYNLLNSILSTLNKK